MSTEPTKQKRAARRAATQTVAEALGVASGAELFKRASDTTLAAQTLLETQKMLETGEHTLDEALQLPATVTNKRKIEKLLQLPERHAEMITAAGLAVQKDLFPKITIAKAEEHARELKEAERKRRQDARAATASATSADAAEPDAKKRKIDAETDKSKDMQVDSKPTVAATTTAASAPPPNTSAATASVVAGTSSDASTAAVDAEKKTPSVPRPPNTSPVAGVAAVKASSSPKGTQKKTPKNSASPTGTQKKAAANVASPKGTRSKKAQASK